MSDTDLLFWGVPKTITKSESALPKLSDAILEAIKYNSIALGKPRIMINKEEKSTSEGLIINELKEIYEDNDVVPDKLETLAEIVVGSTYQVLENDLSNIPIVKDGVIEITHVGSDISADRTMIKIISGQASEINKLGCSSYEGQWQIGNLYLSNITKTKLLYSPTIAPFPVEDVKIGW